MNFNMPKMPGSKSSSGESASISSPLTDGAAQAAPDVSLNIPSHDDVVITPPEMFDLSVNNQSNVSVPASSNKGIEVVATGKGFYNQDRKREDDKFLIRSEEEFGEWMKCVDPVLEKKRIAFYKAKKARK